MLAWNCKAQYNKHIATNKQHNMYANTKQVRAVMRKAILAHNANGRALYSADDNPLTFQSWTDKAKTGRDEKRYVVFAIVYGTDAAVLAAVKQEFSQLGYENYVNTSTGNMGGTYLRCTADIV